MIKLELQLPEGVTSMDTLPLGAAVAVTQIFEGGKVVAYALHDTETGVLLAQVPANQVKVTQS
jgi:hypothetical protein